jgi:FkbM family methyltransferase
MATLHELRAAYESGTLPKADYIKEMHRLHALLFDYASYIGGTDVASIEIAAGEIIFTLRGGDSGDSGLRMLCDPADHRIAPLEILNFGSYEPECFAMAQRFIAPGAIVFDIGANHGWYALNLARRIADIAVHAFEPVPPTFEYLTRNVALNAIHNIHLHNFGFAEQAGDFDFYTYPEGSGNASLADLSGRGTPMSCEVRRLDEFTAEFGSDTKARVDFIKCDVEGNELGVFRGGLRTLATHQPVVLTEMLRKWLAQFGHHPNDIIALFRDLGYRCFTVRDNALVEVPQVDDATIETNFFFLHRVKHAAFL